MKTIRIQAEITAFSGQACNLIAALDAESGLLIVSKELPLGQRAPDVLVTTNNPRADGRDRLFDESKFQNSIRLYFRATAMGMLELLPAVTKYDPAHRIENTGVGEHGAKYTLHPEISNGAVAVLALMDAADVAMNAEGGSEMSREIRDMFLSIGGESYLP